MPTIYDNNLVITSKFGYMRSGQEIISVVPGNFETTKHLWETQERPLSNINFETRILRHQPNPVPSFLNFPGATATNVLINAGLSNPSVISQLKAYTADSTQTITLINEGNSTLNVSTVTQNFLSSFATLGVVHTPMPIAISSGSSASVVVGYYSDVPGDHTNYLLVFSDFPGGAYKINTLQSIQNILSLEIDPTSYVTVADQLGQQVYNSYTITPIINGIKKPDYIIDFSTTIDADSPGWSVINATNNTFTVKFSSMAVSNLNGVYSADITVQSEGGIGVTATSTVSNVVQINVDQTKFQHFGSWVSPAAPYNSVIGMSYDKINNERFLTIGVGTGGDGSAIYEFGGQVFTATSNLGILATATDITYTGWSTVYRMPIGNSPTTYYSSATNASGSFLYKVKSTPGIDYESYFGSEGSRASMFLVDTDGNGNIVVSLNYLRELSGDASLDTTLKNLSRAFHYYSDVDVPGRYYQLDSGPIVDGSVTRLFYGFNNSGTVITSIVNLPVSN